jgi:hypothetical protein
MKKTALGTLAFLLFLASCQKNLNEQPETEVAEETKAITQRKCASQEILEAQLAADPTLRQRMAEIESFTQKTIRNGRSMRLVGDTIEIPVVVHVVYNTAAQNISDGQIQSQIDVLNEDFQNRNADGSKLPANSFQSVASSGMNVRFVLGQIVRKSTKTKSFSTNDWVKSSARGGSDAIDPANQLNLWSCNLGNGVLGYAQFPGGSLSTDGVVILFSAFGSRAKFPSGTYTTTYDLGRTGTHEVGHWMNLRHIWGDDNGSCSGSDLVDDTPNQANANYGCPSYPRLSCSNTTTGDMFMNYMDYTDDKCMYMFSAGQKGRAQAIFAANGPRAAMGN